MKRIHKQTNFNQLFQLMILGITMGHFQLVLPFTLRGGVRKWNKMVLSFTSWGGVRYWSKNWNWTVIHFKRGNILWKWLGVNQKHHIHLSSDIVSGKPKPPHTLMKLVSGQPKQLDTWYQIHRLKKNPKLKLGSLPHSSFLTIDRGEY